MCDQHLAGVEWGTEGGDGVIVTYLSTYLPDAGDQYFSSLTDRP